VIYDFGFWIYDFGFWILDLRFTIYDFFDPKKDKVLPSSNQKNRKS